MVVVDQCHAPAILPCITAYVLTAEEGRWGLGAVWMGREKRKFLAPTWDQTLNRPACSKVLY
jgi:hypothetical protein